MMGAGATDALMLEPGDDPTPSSDPKLALLPLIREFYDRGNLWLFEDAQNLRDLLRLLVPELAVRPDFARARRENRSFIPADLQEQESDLIVSVPFLGEPGREVWIYLLLESAQRAPGPSPIWRWACDSICI